MMISQILNAQYQQDNSNTQFISKIDSVYNDDFLLKNGRYYITEYPRAQGNPFFISDKWIKGEIVIQNKVYKDRYILYDIYNDKILCVINGPAREEFAIKLNNDLVTGFTIENHQFIHSRYFETLPQSGFYEIIYSGNYTNVFFKWKKNYLRIYTKEYMGEFDKAPKVMYLTLNNKSYTIKKKNDLIKLFVENKKLIKTYIKQNHIKLLKSDNDVLTKMFQYCEDLKKSGDEKLNEQTGSSNSKEQ